jgi:hypothetical protein
VPKPARVTWECMISLIFLPRVPVVSARYLAETLLGPAGFSEDLQVLPILSVVLSILGLNIFSSAMHAGGVRCSALWASIPGK